VVLNALVLTGRIYFSVPQGLLGSVKPTRNVGILILRGKVTLFRKILVVCVGNICRSPTAETLLRNALAPSAITVTSAGLAARVGEAMEPSALQVLEDHGHNAQGFKARQITPDIVNESDLILVMEKEHVKQVLKIASHARGKVFLLGKWQSEREIQDPYRQGKAAFIHAHALIEDAVSSWAQRLGH
jgi:protein-tyrosine phosphatase